MTYYTFAETAKYARTVKPSQRPGSIDYCTMIAELAEALDRFEYNTAVQLAAMARHGQFVDSAIIPIQEQSFLSLLREPIPTPPEGDTPQ